MALLGLFDAVAASVRNALRKPVTYQYPEVQRPKPERYRASFCLTTDEHGELSCVACGLCEKICPSQVIKVKAGAKRDSPVTGKKRMYPDDFTLDLSACLQCELCVQVCGSDSIQMVSVPEKPCYSREELFLTFDKLRANEKVPLAWATASRLMAMQEPPKPPKPAPAAAPVAPPAAVPEAAAEKTGGAA
jgi:NADH-quinone oxidoreductase subunit I